MVAELRRVRYGYFLALHVVLLRAAGRPPSDIAAGLFCSRSSVYRAGHAYHAGHWAELRGGEKVEAEHSAHCWTGLSPSLKRAVLGILHGVPRLYGWCRTRWSCATVAIELYKRRRITVSGETVRRWLHELGWAWKRAKVVAKDDDPERVEKLARIRLACEQLRTGTALFFADELDLNLLPKVGYQWMPKGEQGEVMTPGTNEKRYLAGALDITTGTITHCVWYRKQTGLFLDWLETLEETYPAPLFSHLTVVADNAKIHHARKVERWLAAHPRFELLYLPTYCPRANPIERAFGDVHDKCTRNHTRKQSWQLGEDVKRHLLWNGPWTYALSALYYTPEVTAAVAPLHAVQAAPEVLSPLAA
jgi:transposase